MTNYNERIDELLTELRSGTINFDYKAKQALTSLTKALVADAKPKSQSWDGLEPVVQIALSARRKAIDEFEQNILKGLEEV